MPDQNLTAAQREAYAVAPVDEVTLETVEISHPVAGTVYLVNDQQPLTATLETAETVTFEAVGFRAGDPTNGESGSKELNLTINNTDKRISEYIRKTRSSQQETTIKQRNFLASDTSQPSTVAPYTLTVSEVTTTLTQVTIVATFVDVLNRPCPNDIISRETYPSLGG